MEDLHHETEAMKTPQINKESFIKWLRDTRDNVTEGNYDPITAFVSMKEIEKVFKGCFETIYEEAKFSLGEDTQIKNGYKLKKKEGGNAYDYKGIESWAKANVELKKIETIAKFNYNNLSKIDTEVGEDGNVYNVETGELLIVPKVTGKKPSIELTKIKD